MSGGETVEVHAVIQGTREDAERGLIAMAQAEGVTVLQARIGSEAIDPESMTAEAVAAREAVATRGEAIQEPETVLASPDGSETVPPEGEPNPGTEEPTPES